MFGQLKLLPGSSLQTLPYYFYEKKSNKKNSPPNFYPQKGVKNVLTAKIPAEIVFVVPCEPFSRISTNQKFQPPKRGKNVMTAKIPAQIVFVVPCEPFSRKKSKKISPPTFNLRKGMKNVMSAKIPIAIVVVVVSKPFSHKKSKTFFFIPTFVTPFPGVVFTFSR